MGSEPSERGATQCESSDLRKTMKAVRNPRIHQYFTLHYIYPECTAQGQKSTRTVSVLPFLRKVSGFRILNCA